MDGIAEARRLIRLAAAAGRTALSEQDAKAVLSAFGLDVPRNAFVPHGHSSEAAVTSLRPPFVVKVVSAAILHKTEVGGVRLGLSDRKQVQVAIAEMGRAIEALGHPIEGWLVEEMVPKGPEIVIGGTVDPSFGPTIMVGLGGILVELIADVAFRLCPIDETDAAEMLEELRGVKLLRGWRGAASVDEPALRDVLMRIGGADGLMMSLSDLIEELDINPIIASQHRVVAADARIVLRERPSLDD